MENLNLSQTQTEMTFSLIFTEKKRIKIINKNGFDAATITIPLYVSDNNKSEKLEQLNASTYNLENDKVVETKLGKSSVLTEKNSKNWIYKKFTFPDLKEGSIIEYSYSVKSDFFFNLQPWTFQGRYPILWSQYEAGIPEFYKYVILSQGYQPFLINKVQNSKRSYHFVEHADIQDRAAGGRQSSFTVDGVEDYHIWVMKDVPALKEEAFTTTLRNAVNKLEFQLNAVVFPNTAPRLYMSTWEQVASELMTDNNFGAPIQRPNNWLDNDVHDIVKNSSGQKEKARKIFDYIRDNFTCNEDDKIYITTNLKDVFKNRTGSVADINSLLIAMLRSQAIAANPVILSTRNHGLAHEMYPLLNRYNYVIVKAVIDDNAYYLDATAKEFGFGMLPPKVYNGQAREITPQTAIPIYFDADSLEESDKTNVFITNLDNGSIEGTLVHNFSAFESGKMRERMKKMAIEEFKKSVKDEYPEEITVDNIRLDSLKMLNEPVALTYDLAFKSFKEDDIVYFNPMLGAGIKKNPFIAADRFYPVEMPYTINEVYNLSMAIPNGYRVDELPKSVRLMFNEDEGMFEYLISADAMLVQARCILTLKKANFMIEDYHTLRDFYAFIVKKEAEQIVFKKIN